MPSSLATVLSLTSGFSPCPPVSVLVRAAYALPEAFPGSRHHVLRYFPWISLACHALALRLPDLPGNQPARLHTIYQSRADLPSCVTPSFKRSLPVLEYQPVVHLLRSLPRIRSRLTLRRRALLRNPYSFGGKDSHLSFRYSCQHSHFPPVHRPFQDDFNPMGTLLYHAYLRMHP